MGDANKPDRGDQNNTKCVQNNIVAASFSYENQKGLFSNISEQLLAKNKLYRKNKMRSKIGNAKSTCFSIHPQSLIMVTC